MSELLKRYLNTPPNEWRHLAPFVTLHMLAYRARLLRCRYLDQHEWRVNDSGESCRFCGLDKEQGGFGSIVQPLYEYRLIIERPLGDSRVAREASKIDAVRADKLARYWRDKAERVTSEVEPTRGRVERREVTFWVDYFPDEA